MAEIRPTERLSLTLSLPPSLALRLTRAAEAKRRSVAEEVVDLLDRHLPQANAPEKKGKIPYT